MECPEVLCTDYIATWHSFTCVDKVRSTLASGIDVGQVINVGPGKFGEKNTCKGPSIKDVGPF